MDIKQFKLSNGEEVVCEVVEWHDEENADIIVRDSYKIVSYQSSRSADRYHTFMPWMVLQEGEGLFQSINADMVVGSCSPTEEILKEYWKLKEHQKGNDVSSEELEERMNEYINELKNLLLDHVTPDAPKYEFLDSDGKVISFPAKDKMH